MSITMSEISRLFFSHLDDLYHRLTLDLHEIWLPEKERIAQALQDASFMSFDSPDQYFSQERSRQYPLRISARVGREVFRVYFNEHSRKIYVDVNVALAETFLSAKEGVIELGSEIVRSILFTDPDLLGDETNPTEIIT